MSKKVTLYRYMLKDKKVTLDAFNNCTKNEIGYSLIDNESWSRSTTVVYVRYEKLDVVYTRNYYIMWSLSSDLMNNFIKQCISKKEEFLRKKLKEVKGISSDIKVLESYKKGE